MKIIQLAVAALLLAFAPAAQSQDSLEALSYMEGKWAVTSAFYGEGKWEKPSAPMRATADTVLGGSFIRVNAPVSFPGGTFQFEMTVSYDRFHALYRTAFLDDLNGYMDIYQGKADGGKISVTNADTGSSFPDGNGGVVIGKLDFEKSENGFVVTSFVAAEKAGPYSPYMQLVFSKAE